MYEAESFQSSTELQEYIDQSASVKDICVRRRLFLMEDLSRNYIEILSSQICIPPRVFAAHYDEPTAPTFNHRGPFMRFSENQFIIRFATSQRVEIEVTSEVQDTVYAWNANVNRVLHFYDPNGPLVDDPKSCHALSFWTACIRDDKSWDGTVNFYYTLVRRFVLLMTVN